MISDEIALKIRKECGFDDYSSASPSNMTDSCDEAIDSAYNTAGPYINAYDVIIDVCYPSLLEQELRLKRSVLEFTPELALQILSHH